MDKFQQMFSISKNEAENQVEATRQLNGNNEGRRT